MGEYAEALAIGASLRQAPDIARDDRPGRKKYGFGVNLEQPLTDDGETGVFGRFGWNDGKNESFAFTEVDRHLSAGAQVCGAHWGRANDRIGLAGVSERIVPVHRAYLAAGGVGFLLGDGRLTYGSEQILEGYYRMQAGRFLELTSDVQRIRNPGYNRDRGPAVVGSLRANFRY
jgi:carbohydrate-selective porin OprB